MISNLEVLVTDDESPELCCQRSCYLDQSKHCRAKSSAGIWSLSPGGFFTCCVFVCAAPIQGLSLELSRLSGYEEMKCTVHDVFPAPRVTWATEPPTFEDLRPTTRILANKQGLYTVDSRLKMLNGQPDLIYICKVTTSYGGPAWMSSLRERGENNDVMNLCALPNIR